MKDLFFEKLEMPSKRAMFSFQKFVSLLGECTNPLDDSKKKKFAFAYRIGDGKTLHTDPLTSRTT